MKKPILGISFIIVLVFGFLWWQQYKQDKAFMESLLLHQPIEINQVDAINIWEKGKDIKKVPTEDYIKVVDWFSQYQPNRVSEEKVPHSDAQVVIDLKAGQTIIINYVDQKIFVSRTDVGIGIEYVFLDDAPKLENFFKELLN